MSFYTKLLSCVLILCFASIVNAFPRGCEVTGFAFSQNNLIINDTGAQSFYLIQNHSHTTVKLQRYENRETFMSPPLTATLDPSNWAAFASDVANLNFQCSIIENDNPIQIDCRDALDVCRYPRVKFALSNMGNYWVSTNKAQNQVLTEATSKGILLKW